MNAPKPRLWKKLWVGGEHGQLLQSVCREARISDKLQEAVLYGQFHTFVSKRLIGLVKPRVCDLGYPEGARNRQIIARVQKLGLVFCPDEAAFYLRAAYVNQPSGEILSLPTRSILDKRSFSEFVLTRHSKVEDGRPLLDVGSFPLGSFRQPDDVIILARWIR